MQWVLLMWWSAIDNINVIMYSWKLEKIYFFFEETYVKTRQQSQADNKLIKEAIKPNRHILRIVIKHIN